MTKLDIYGGLLGAGKTTLIRQMLRVSYMGYKVAIIENEIGKVNLDAEELKGASFAVREISSGCICCTVKGSFTEAVRLLAEQERPEYIVVEPSGTANLADVVNACMKSECVTLNRVIMVVNAKKMKSLLKVVGDFFLEQLRYVRTVYLNFTEYMSAEQLEEVEKSLWEINDKLSIVAVPLLTVSKENFPEEVDVQEFREKRYIALSSPFASGAKAGPIRMRPFARKTGMSSWSYMFAGKFREEDIAQLLAIFRQETCAEIWRVKGYMRMHSGKIRKIDIAFGDVFLEELESFADDKVNTLVVIGKKLDILWLQSRLEALRRCDEI